MCCRLAHLHTLLFAGHPGLPYRVLSSAETRDQESTEGGCLEEVESFNRQPMPAGEKEDLRGCRALLQRLVVSVPTLHSRRQMGLLGSSAGVTGG